MYKIKKRNLAERQTVYCLSEKSLRYLHCLGIQKCDYTWLPASKTSKQSSGFYWKLFS